MYCSSLQINPLEKLGIGRRAANKTHFAKYAKIRGSKKWNKYIKQQKRRLSVSGGLAPQKRMSKFEKGSKKGQVTESMKIGQNQILTMEFNKWIAPM